MTDVAMSCPRERALAPPSQFVRRWLIWAVNSALTCTAVIVAFVLISVTVGLGPMMKTVCEIAANWFSGGVP